MATTVPAAMIVGNALMSTEGLRRDGVVAEGSDVDVDVENALMRTEGLRLYRVLPDVLFVSRVRNALVSTEGLRLLNELKEGLRLGLGRKQPDEYVPLSPAVAVPPSEFP